MLSPFVNSEELKAAETLWIKENQKCFDNKKLDSLTKDLNLICDKNGLIRCKGRLKNTPLPYDTKTPVLLNSNYRLAELIVIDFHTKLHHISIKQTLTEVRQKFWILKGKNFIRKILRKCITCKKFNSQSYQYPTTPPLAKLRMCDNYSFYATGVDNFGPLFVKSMFSSDSSTMHKVWVTLYTCPSSRTLLLDLVLSKSLSDFIKSFKRFVSRKRVPNNAISDGSINFVSVESQEFMNGLGVNWVTNMPYPRGMEGFLNDWLGVQKSYWGKC